MTLEAASTKLYAPQARLVDLATGKVVGATKLTADGDAVVAPDIISAKATLTNTGVGQLQVTLNNQRFVDGKPIFPPWKYNDFSLARSTAEATTDGLGGLTFGQLLRLDFRYGGSGWVKMIVAQVNDLQFSFPATGGAQLQVIGEDLLCRAKLKPDADKTYSNEHEEDIARDTWARAFAGASSFPTFTILDGERTMQGRTRPMRSLRHNKTNTYLQFLQEMADRLDFELFIAFKDERVAVREHATALQAEAGPIVVGDELNFCFQLARSQYAPQGEVQDGLDPGTDAAAPELVTYELRWGRNLLEFSPRFKVFEIPTTAAATGTEPGARARRTQDLTRAEIDTLLRNELPPSPAYTGVDPVTALDARDEFFQGAGAGTDNGESQSGSNLDAPRLKTKAGAQFMKKVREFATADGQVIGLPRMRPGNYVHIVGLRPPFDGYHYLTKTVHTLDATGYKTQFSVRRPGMLPPAQYLPPPTPPPGAPGAAP